MAKVITYKTLKAPSPHPSDFRIERGVAIPNWATRKYPFGEMEVGDSFLIEIPDAKRLRQVRAAACFFGKRNDRLYAVRKDPKKPGSYRCWRTE